MPTTRSSNSKAAVKAYYSKKAAPYQQHFPHRRKVVRRPETHDDGGKKQLKFLPEMMRRRGTVQDSDEEGGELLEEEEEVEEVEVVGRGGRNRRKRNSGVMQEGSEEEKEEDEVVQPVSKRRRKSAEHNNISRTTRRRGRPTPIESAPEESSVSGETEEEETKPRTRRQSTMTQLVDGRSPAPGSLDPEFKPIKRTPRTSWGGKGTKPAAKKDLKQRTLTQMVHTMTPLAPDSNDEPPTETDEEADAAHHSFIFGDTPHPGINPTSGDRENHSPAETSLPPPTSYTQDEYHPTQFIDAPATKTRRTPLRSAKRSAAPQPKPRFSLLPTPEKRRIREIPSSQSPPSTPLSTQPTPLRPRSVNKAREGRNEVREVSGKQVTFMDGPREKIPPLRKFASTIPDSEEEGGWSDEEEEEVEEGGEECGVGGEGQGVLSGVDIGVETQALLFKIDRACASADGDVEWDRGGSEEPRERGVHMRGEVSQELGGGIEWHEGSTSDEDISTETLELPPLPFSSPQPRDDGNANAEPSTDMETPPVVQAFPSSPPIEDFRTRSPTPMFNDDDDEEEEEEEDPTIIAAPSHSLPPNPPHSTPPLQDFLTNPPIPMFNDSTSTSFPSSTPPPLATGTTLHSIQVPRSPPTHIKTEPSHSSQAERQLHSEQERYSQYCRPHPPPSSMHVAHDSTYNYQATPRPAAPVSHSVSNTFVSQATTIDPTQSSPRATPRKQRVKPPMFVSPSRVPKSTQPRDRVDMTPKTHRQRGGSAPATPKSARMETLSMSSPEAGRPAPLFIPSSFPSPARVTMEGWSSPVGPAGGRDGGESQWGVGSLEDFSIPAPPPGSSQWVDDE